MSGQPEVVVESGWATLTFFWKDGRYQHRVWIRGDTRESTDADGFCSPVYTDIYQQDSVVFVSGQGDGYHWSASIEIEDSVVVFDVACRASKSGGKIGSAYVGKGLCIEPSGEPSANIPLAGIDPWVAAPWHIHPKGEWAEPPCTLRYCYRIKPTA